MKAWIKAAARRVLPRALIARLTRHRRIHFTGPFASWGTASRVCTGYAAPNILNKVIAASREVVAGRAAFERDSLAFHEPQPDPLLVREFIAATPRDGTPLRVLDFGGSLGSTYHLLRGALPRDLQWHIIEQPSFVAAGKAEFETATLHFHATVEEATRPGPPHVVLLASVLPYLESPWAVLEQLARLPARAWLVTRTSFSDGPDDAVVVQHVPASIYKASYPAWVLSRPKFAAFWSARGAALSWHGTDEGCASTGRLGFAFRTVIVMPLPTEEETASP